MKTINIELKVEVGYWASFNHLQNYKIYGTMKKMFYLQFLNSFMFEGSMRGSVQMFLFSLQLLASKVKGWAKKFAFGYYGTPKLHAWRFHERPNTKYFCSSSNFRHQKLEPKQQNLPQAFLKTRAPKVTTFKGQNFSSNEFPQCNSWFLFNLLYFISLIAIFYWNKKSIHKGIFY